MFVHAPSSIIKSTCKSRIGYNCNAGKVVTHKWLKRKRLQLTKLNSWANCTVILLGIDESIETEECILYSLTTLTRAVLNLRILTDFNTVLKGIHFLFYSLATDIALSKSVFDLFWNFFRRRKEIRTGISNSHSNHRSKP